MKIAILSLATTIVMATAASAAPFCVVSQYGDKCYYYDAPSCQRAAAREGSTCVVDRSQLAGNQSITGGPNPFDSSIFGGGANGAPYCMVTQFGEECRFRDLRSCQQTAQRSRGACVVNENRQR